MCQKAENYRRRAEEIRTIADSMADKEAREKLYKIATEYELWAEKRENAGAPT